METFNDIIQSDSRSLSNPLGSHADDFQKRKSSLATTGWNG